MSKYQVGGEPAVRKPFAARATDPHVTVRRAAGAKAGNAHGGPERRNAEGRPWGKVAAAAHVAPAKVAVVAAAPRTAARAGGESSDWNEF